MNWRRCVASTASTLVVFNHELTPAQQRNLEERLECRVMTRTELILHIFADRARTHEGTLQVQLAQLTHAETRLIRGWTHLDRQTGVGGAGGRGAGGRIGGGVQRGAGETQLEMDQRMLAVRVRQVRAPGSNGFASDASTEPPSSTALENPDGRSRGLHQRRQVDLVQRPDGKPCSGREPAVRDAGSDHPPPRGHGAGCRRLRHGRASSASCR